jgi:hypothetical protein
LRTLAAPIVVAFLFLPTWQLASSAAAVAGGRDLWVDVVHGSDSNDGSSPQQALQTIQSAASAAVPGTVVHILPGVYREAIVPAADGTADARIVYKAEGGRGTVKIRGSVPASSLSWTRLSSNAIGLPAGVDPTNIYYADLSGWKLTRAPRFLVELNDQGEVASRWMPAREPDARSDAEWKDTEYWWLADGGSAVAECDPITNPDRHCDLPWRSFTQLTDTSVDVDPPGIEPGSLATLPDLSGATLVAMDAQHGLYVYRRTIISDDVSAGRITLDAESDNDGAPGLGWGSKYYVENHPALLDQPREWWFDAATSRLYLWSPGGQDPSKLNLEISRWNRGFDLTNRSYITVDGLSIELFNGQAYIIWNDNPKYKSFGNILQNATLRYANEGLALYQYTDDQTPPGYAVDGFVLEGSEVSYMDTYGITSSFWWPDAPAPERFHYSGVRNTVFRNNDLHHLGFNSEARSAVGARIFFPDKLRFENNAVHDVANAGVHFQLSIVDSVKSYGFSPQEIQLGDILVANNVFDRTCLRASDCGALKFGGADRPSTHVFRNVLITGNVFRNTIGWSYVSALRGATDVGDGNGLYVDYASGIHAYRNITYNNTGAGFKLSCLWRDGDVVLYNNIAANNRMYGFKLGGGGSCDSHKGSVNTQIANNILINNEGYGMQIESSSPSGEFGNLTIDYNLYYENGWNSEAGWGSPADIQLYQGERSARYLGSLGEIRSVTPWEQHGAEGDPAFLVYDAADHNAFDGSWPDFHPDPGGLNAIDHGTASLPASLTNLLSEFAIPDARLGAAFDIGRFETQASLPTSTPTPTPVPPADQVCLPGALAGIILPLLAILPRQLRRSPRSQA